MAAALLVAGAGLMPMTSCEQFDDSELKQQITDINDRLTALETEMDTQLAALQAIVDGKTTILSCLLDEETGMYTITLSDKENTVIEIPAVGNEMVPVLTYIEEEGVKYWATVSEGGVKTAMTDAAGNKIPVEAETPVLKLGENGEWMVSADGSSWTSLGVTSENAAIFAKAEETETSVIFTLADGTELEVNKFDAAEADIYPLVGKQFFDAGEERIIEFVLEGISNIAVMEVPAGWHAVTTRSSLTVTAPAADDTDGFPHIRKSRGGGRRGTGCLCQALVRSRPLRQPLPPVHLDLPDMLQPLHRPPPPQEENAMALHLSFPQQEQEHVPNHASYPGKTASLILESHGIGRRPIHGTRTATGL